MEQVGSSAERRSRQELINCIGANSGEIRTLTAQLESGQVKEWEKPGIIQRISFLEFEITIAKQEQRIYKLEEENKRLRRENDEKNATVSKTQTELHEAQYKIQILTAKQLGLAAQVNSMKGQCYSAQGVALKMIRLEAKLNTVKAELNAANAAKEATEATTVALQTENARLQAIIAELRAGASREQAAANTTQNQDNFLFTAINISERPENDVSRFLLFTSIEDAREREQALGNFAQNAFAHEVFLAWLSEEDDQMKDRLLRLVYPIFSQAENEVYLNAMLQGYFNFYLKHQREREKIEKSLSVTAGKIKELEDEIPRLQADLKEQMSEREVGDINEKTVRLIRAYNVFSGILTGIINDYKLFEAAYEKIVEDFIAEMQRRLPESINWRELKEKLLNSFSLEDEILSQHRKSKAIYTRIAEHILLLKDKAKEIEIEMTSSPLNGPSLKLNAENQRILGKWRQSIVIVDSRRAELNRMLLEYLLAIQNKEFVVAKQMYRKLARKLHPDANDGRNSELFQLITNFQSENAKK